jgi:hypothetical protein
MDFRLPLRSSPNSIASPIHDLSIKLPQMAKVNCRKWAKLVAKLRA